MAKSLKSIALPQPIPKTGNTDVDNYNRDFSNAIFNYMNQNNTVGTTEDVSLLSSDGVTTVVLHFINGFYTGQT